jgi:hypothetical protein
MESERYANAHLQKRARRLNVVFAIVLMAALIAPAWSAPGAAPQAGALPAPQSPDGWNYYLVDYPPYAWNMTSHSLRMRSDGIPCVAYGGDHLYYSCLNLVSGKWSVEMVPDFTPRVGEFAALAFNDLNQPFISYYDVTNAWLKLAYKIGGIWTVVGVDTPIALDALPQSPKGFEPENTLPNPYLRSTADSPLPAVTFPDKRGVGKYNAIAIDANNRVHISYYDEINGDLKYARWDGVVWNFEIAVPHYHDQIAVGLHTSIAIDSQFQVHISYLDEKYDDLMYTMRKTNGDWKVVLVDQGDGIDKYKRVGSYTSIVVDKDDRPHIVYQDFDTYDLKYARPNNLGVWKEEFVMTSGKVGYYNSITVDGQNRIHVSYYDLSNGNLMHLRRGDDGGWTNQIAAKEGNVGLFSSIVTDGDNMPGITYLDLTEGEVRYVHFNKLTNKWDKSTVNRSSDVGVSSSLALSPDGAPYISYMNETTDQLKFARTYGTDHWFLSTLLTEPHAGAFSSVALKDGYLPRIAFYNMDYGGLLYAYQSGAFWFFENVDVSKVDEDGNRAFYNTGLYVDMALDSNGDPHVSYYNADEGDLMYAYRNPITTDWITRTIDTGISGGDVGMYTSIAIDAFDKPHISYYDPGKADLKHAYISIINAWATEFVDQSLNDVGTFSSIDFDILNRPHIAYYDATFKDLKHAYWDGLAWQTEFVEVSADATGMYASLKFDWLNHGHIAYYNATAGDLMYAYWDGLSWTTSTVDSSGDVGMFCSLDVGQEAPLPTVGISYYDNTAGDLRYVASAPLPPMKIWAPLVLQH